MTTTTIRVSEPRELLAYLPYRLGFRPRESVVVMSLRGARSRLGLVARVDLADMANSDDGARVAGGLAAHLWRDGAEQAVVVVYADAAREGGTWRTDVVEAAGHALEAIETNVGPAQVWVVDAERYYAFGCSDDECCPPQGWPLDDLDSTQVSAQMVFAGASVAGHRGEITAVTPAPKGARYNVGRVADRWARRREGAEAKDLSPGGTGELAAWHVASLRSWQSAVVAVGGGSVPTSRDLGRIGAALEDHVVRDAVIMSFATSTEEAIDAVARPTSRTSEHVGAAIGALFDDGAAPDGEQLRHRVHVLREVVAHTPDGEHAPALTLLGVLAWWSGNGAAANCWLDKALAARPGYRLADLFMVTLESGLAPGWAQRSAAEDAGLR